MKTPATRILALAAALGLVAGVQAQPRSITNNMVVHLSFDNTLNDDTGRGNNAAYNSTNGLSVQPANPTFVPGKLGQGFQYNSYPDASLIEYATLGYPNDLKFGTNTDFSIAFWFKTDATNLASDPALISNRDWNSSGSRGWGIFLQGGRTTVRLNATTETGGVVSQRVGPPGAGNAYDGNFHHVAAVFQRGVSTKFYVDGVLGATQTTTVTNTMDTDTNLVGTLQVPETVNIGQDGTGTYTQNSTHDNPPASAGGAGVTNAVVDDVAIWRRALTDLEVINIYNFAQLGTNVYNVPDVHTPILISFTPGNGAVGVPPNIPTTAVIQDGSSTALDPSSVKLTVDGVLVSHSFSKVVTTNTITYTSPFLFAPLTTHTNKLAWADNGTPVPARFTNTTVYTVANWSNIYLPPPLYLETFDEVVPATNAPVNWPADTTGNYPVGWTVTNCTSMNATWDILDPHSDYYGNFAVVPVEIIVSKFNYDGNINNVYSPLVVNGVPIASPLGSGNIVFAASDQRQNGPQADYLFTPDFDLTGKTNIWMAYRDMYTQEDGQLAAIEYSIDQGATWLPIIYMITAANAIVTNGVVDPWSTMTNSFPAVQPNDCGADPTTQNYGTYVGVDSSLWGTLIPYISLRTPDNHVIYHTVEKFRLPQADNQAHVRFRFAFEGRDYWDWGFDSFGLYSITEEPLQITSVSKSGNSVTINWNGTGANSASGLQKNTSLSAPAAWVNISGTIGLSTFTEPAGAGPVYYRAIRY